MLNPIIGWIPTNFFFEATEGLPQAATNEAPAVKQAESPAQPPAADHEADGARVRRSKALPRSGNRDRAQLHVPHACARKPAQPLPPQVEVLANEAEVVRGLAQLTALDSMAEPQR